MSETHRLDPYDAVALIEDHDFELRTPAGLAVPLHFEPDAAYIMRSLLTARDYITTGNISRETGFRVVVPLGPGGYGFNQETFMAQHSRKVFSSLIFTFNALGSTLIRAEHDATALVAGTNRYTKSTIYRRNPAYAVLDERPGPG